MVEEMAWEVVRGLGFGFYDVFEKFFRFYGIILLNFCFFYDLMGGFKFIFNKVKLWGLE
jgi:hypothetical protein